MVWNYHSYTAVVVKVDFKINNSSMSEQSLIAVKVLLSGPLPSSYHWYSVPMLFVIFFYLFPFAVLGEKHTCSSISTERKISNWLTLWKNIFQNERTKLQLAQLLTDDKVSDINANIEALRFYIYDKFSTAIRTALTTQQQAYRSVYLTALAKLQEFQVGLLGYRYIWWKYLWSTLKYNARPISDGNFSPNN